MMPVHVVLQHLNRALEHQREACRRLARPHDRLTLAIGRAARLEKVQGGRQVFLRKAAKERTAVQAFGLGPDAHPPEN